MKKKTKKKIREILNLPLWLNLLITIIGVILGIALTNLYQDYKLRNDYEEAMNMVITEIRDNHKMLINYNEQMSTKFEAFKFFDLHLEEDLTVLVHKDSIEEFKIRVKPIFIIDSLLKDSNEMMQISGEIDISVASQLMSGKLRNSVWNAFLRRPEFLNISDFETIANLEHIYTYQAEVNEQIKGWKTSIFSDFIDSEMEREKFKKEWFVLVMNETILLEMYKQELSKTH